MVIKTKRVLGFADAKAGIGNTLTDSLRESWTQFNGSMASLSNQWPPPPGSTGDFGGPWVQDYTEDLRSKLAVDTGVRLNKRLKGDIVVVAWPSDPVGYTSSPLTEAAARTFGTTAIARTEPTSEYFSGATALGELVADGLPGGASIMMMRDRVALARSSGKAYLSAEFGWLPLVNDVKTLVKSVRRSEKIMSSYLKGSDHRIRRRYGLPSVTASGAGTGNFVFGPDYGSVVFNSSSRQGTVVMRSETRTSFSGAFRYHIPASVATSGIQRHALTARKVYGLELTPEVIWNLAPWSWALDWFGNVGDVMHNVSALGRDGLVMDYGYVMSGRVTEQSYACFSSYGVLTRDVKIVSRRRYAKLSPYGFGVTWAGLTPRQVAVTAALGLSRAPF